MIPFRLSAVTLSMRKRGRRDSEEISDEALLAGMALGDDGASLIFVRRYQHRLFGLAMQMVGEAALAEDIAQEAFIRILRHAAIFDARRGSVSTWALTITRNLAIDALRFRRSLPVDPDDRVFAELMSPDRPPEDVALAGDVRGRLGLALRRLPIDQRRAVVLAGLYGRTANEIADAETIPLGTAKSRIRAGMAKLRDMAEIEEIQ
jgi:RNA polymerase sigma factor (sigma-70 family)